MALPSKRKLLLLVEVSVFLGFGKAKRFFWRGRLHLSDKYIIIRQVFWGAIDLETK